jgi:hypothetical protein
MCMDIPYNFNYVNIVYAYLMIKNVFTMRIKPTSAYEYIWFNYFIIVVNSCMFRPPFVAIFREVFYEGYNITKITTPMYKYKI